jgi:hypothetical protein
MFSLLADVSRADPVACHEREGFRYEGTLWTAPASKRADDGDS